MFITRHQSSSISNNNNNNNKMTSRGKQYVDSIINTGLFDVDSNETTIDYLKNDTEEEDPNQLDENTLDNIKEYAKRHSKLVFYNGHVYKAENTKLFKDGLSWRTGINKFHISKNEKVNGTPNRYRVFITGHDGKPEAFEDHSVTWPSIDEDIYRNIMNARKSIAIKKNECAIYSKKVELKLKNMHNKLKRKRMLQWKSEQN